MNIKEMKAMEGTEFMFVFSCGDTIPAYVKKFDETTGFLSCWSFSLTTEKGFKFKPINVDEEREEACCVIGTKCLADTHTVLKEIQDTGRRVRSPIASFFGGCSL